MEGFLHYGFGGLIFGRAYKWRGLFSEFNGILQFLFFFDFHQEGGLSLNTIIPSILTVLRWIFCQFHGWLYFTLWSYNNKI